MKVNKRKLVADLELYCDGLERSDCMSICCKGPDKRPRFMRTCARCWALWTIRRRLAAAKAVVLN